MSIGSLGICIELKTPAKLTSLLGYNSGLGIESYFFAVSVSQVEFFEFYQNLAPTDGWMVFSHIGKVFTHHFCEAKEDFVIINKGDAQIILYHTEGGIIADYDTKHIYSSL